MKMFLECETLRQSVLGFKVLVYPVNSWDNSLLHLQQEDVKGMRAIFQKDGKKMLKRGEIF